MNSSEAALIRRAVVIPPDLFAEAQRLARRDGFHSVAAWVVVQVQAIATARLAASRKTT